VVWTRIVSQIESIIWSIFTVKVMIIDFDFYCHCDRHSCNALIKMLNTVHSCCR